MWAFILFLFSKMARAILVLLHFQMNWLFPQQNIFPTSFIIFPSLWLNKIHLHTHTGANLKVYTHKWTRMVMHTQEHSPTHGWIHRLISLDDRCERCCHKQGCGWWHPICHFLLLFRELSALYSGSHCFCPCPETFPLCFPVCSVLCLSLRTLILWELIVFIFRVRRV